jgi:2,4-dienoyl-CoA reductase-like NADH-dependent reductase (Old Yellow Enzyme family)
VSSLFDPLTLAGVTLKNRIAVSPMCQYSATEGLPTPWHMVHLGSRAVGGAGLVFTEATAVEARGRISPEDTGIWNDAQAERWAPIARFVAEQGSAPGMQLAHAGRKASTAAPWNGGKGLEAGEAGGWRPTFAPSAIAFAPDYPMPQAMSVADIDEVVAAFADATKRAVGAGFQVIEIHGAHGYLLHEFLSPLSNQRSDEYGGSLENRSRIVRRVVAAVRGAAPERVPIMLRISATDWAAESGGWDLEQSCALVESLKDEGLALVDVSSGGTLAHATIPVGPGYQTPFAAEIRRRTGVPTGTVGMIVGAEQADHVVRTRQADMVLLAREMLRDPYWPRRAAKELGVKIVGPKQYGRAW